MKLQHYFLIVMPVLQDPLFKDSVIYICEHDSNDAMSIVINKFSEQFTVENVSYKLKIIPADCDIAIWLDNALVSLNYFCWKQAPLERELLENSSLTISPGSEILFYSSIANSWHESSQNHEY